MAFVILFIISSYGEVSAHGTPGTHSYDLVLNGGFEFSDVEAIYWTVSPENGANGSHAIDTQNSHEGSNSLRIDPAGAQPEDLYVLVQPVNLSDYRGLPLHLEAACSMKGTEPWAAFGVILPGGESAVTFVPNDPTPGFKVFTADWTVPGDADLGYLLLAGGGTGGTVRLDGFTARVTGVPGGAPSASEDTRYEKGVFGQALLLDGYGRCASFPIEEVLSPYEGTVEVWVRPRFDPGESPELGVVWGIEWGPFSITGENPCALLFFSEGGNVGFMPDGNLAHALWAPPFYHAGEWHHLAVTWGPRGTELYVDGEPACLNPSVKYLHYLDDTLFVGPPPALKGAFCSFDADELRISSIQRDPAEIHDSASAKAPAKKDGYTTLLARFDGTPPLPVHLVQGEGFHMAAPGTGADLDVQIPLNGVLPYPGDAILHVLGTDMNGDEVFAAAFPLTGLSGDANGTWNVRHVALPPVAQPACLNLSFHLALQGAPGRKAEGTGSLWVAGGAPATGAFSFFGTAGCFNDTFIGGDLFKRLHQAGVSWFRLPFEWREIEPENDQFHFEKYDALVAAAEAEGIRLVPTFQWEHPIPEWVNAGPVQVEVDGVFCNCPPEDLEEWKEYVYTVTARYKGEVTHWIPWNEPNLQQYWYPVDAAKYTDLLQATREAVLAADPGAFIVGINACLFDKDYYEACFALGALDACDAVGIHPYNIPEDTDTPSDLIGFIDPASRPLYFREQLSGLAQLIQAYGTTPKIWIDEVGQNTENDFIPGEYVSEDFQARILVKMCVEALSTGVVEKLLWFAPYGHLSFDLLDLDYDPRPACAAYRVCAEMLADKEFDATLYYGPCIKAFRFRKGTEIVTVAWSIGINRRVTLWSAGGVPEVLDKYGLPFPARAAGNGISLELTPEPCYILGDVTLTCPAGK